MFYGSVYPWFKSSLYVQPHPDLHNLERLFKSIHFALSVTKVTKALFANH